MRPTIIHSTSSWLTVLLITLFVVAGCKKTETPDPDLAAKVMGTYTLSAIGISGGSQPVTGGTVVLLRNGAALDKVDITLSYATAGQSGSSSFSESRTLSLQPSGNAITLLSGTTQVGSWVNNTITFTNYPFNNTTVSFTATR